MSARTLLFAQLVAYGGKVVPSDQIHGHLIYPPGSGQPIAAVEGSDAGPDGHVQGRQQLLDVLRVAVQSARTAAGEFVVIPSDDHGWLDIRHRGVIVASCRAKHAAAVIAGLADHKITHEERP